MIWKESKLSVKGIIDELGFTTPTEIQTLTWGPIQKGKSIMAAAQTGTGKTFAYSLPLALYIKKLEQQEGPNEKKAAPRAIIFCPTRELAEQVFLTLKVVCHHVKLRVRLALGGTRMSSLKSEVMQPLDILVTTTGCLLKLRRSRLLYYTQLRTVVLDEADTLFDMGFFDDLSRLFSPKVAPKFQTLTFSAVLPPSLSQRIKQLFGNCEKKQTKDLHLFVKQMKPQFIQVSPKQKTAELVKVLNKSEQSKVLVFCNAIKRCQFLAGELEEKGLKVSSLHGDIPPKKRASLVEEFLNTPDTNILVCSDIAARGLDILSCDHVINYDMPKSESMFLHRAGRTARAGKKGTVTTLLTPRDYVIANAINEVFKLGLPVTKARKEVQKQQKLKTKKPTNARPKPKVSNRKGTSKKRRKARK